MSSAEVEPAPAADQPAVGNDAGMFVRKSSGLVREMGIRDALSVALSGINPAIVVAIFFVYLSFASNADLTLPYIAAAILMVPLTFAYGQMVATMPRSGGDFVFLSRIFHPAVGAAVGIGFLLFTFLNLGANAVNVGTLALPEFARATGEALNSHALLTFSETLGHQSAQMISAAVVIVGCCLIAMRGAHVLARAMFWCFAVAVVALIILVIEGLTHSNGAFQSAYDSAHGAGAYQHVIAAAHANDVSIGGTASGFVKILPYAAIGFWGFTVGNYPAGEMKRPGRTYTWATLGGLFAGAAFLVVGWLAMKHLVGLHFLQSAAGLNGANSEALEHITGGAPLVTQYYADLVSGAVPKIIISGGFVIGGLMFVMAMVLISSRLLFAISFDRLLPERLADVNERTHAPTKALVVAMIGGLLFAYLTIYSTGFVHVTRNQVLIWAALFTIGSIAATALAYRRRDLYEASPKIIGGKWLGLEPITVIGAVSAVIQGALLVIAATNESISGGYDTGSIVTLAIVAFSGVFVYAISRAYFRRSTGIDIDLAMHELPPD
jgi:APA family basic amino acid/polyamine antiporter